MCHHPPLIAHAANLQTSVRIKNLCMYVTFKFMHVCNIQIAESQLPIWATGGAEGLAGG